MGPAFGGQSLQGLAGLREVNRPNWRGNLTRIIPGSENLAARGAGRPRFPVDGSVAVTGRDSGTRFACKFCFDPPPMDSRKTVFEDR